MNFFPLLPSVSSILFFRNDIDDRVAEVILTEASFPLVGILDLPYNNLTKVPSSILTSLPRVFFISLDGNPIKVLPTDSLAFPSNPIGWSGRAIYLQSMALATIEPGAFKGPLNF